ncbi:hypothetical protein CDL15_Pgr004386 [Punica granatum]|uniref:Uncharacterized protein n=1 Tax=Punica granatum TaxID=22663 RepID=A0A218XFF4_PUNGR|nr:hypothetical protein CDL15_Pgr004386 [Punica granatum]
MLEKNVTVMKVDATHYLFTNGTLMRNMTRDGYDVSLEEFDWHARILCCFLVKPMPNGQDLVMVDEVDVANMLEDLWESYFLVLAPDIESYRGNFANLIVGGAA